MTNVKMRRNFAAAVSFGLCPKERTKRVCFVPIKAFPGKSNIQKLPESVTGRKRRDDQLALLYAGDPTTYSLPVTHQP